MGNVDEQKGKAKELKGWTDEQKKIIGHRDSNILVSAAAGSGKTTVLVERICQKIMSEESPKNVDEFLVVTFTKAAAAQMKEKISKKIEKELEKELEEIDEIKELKKCREKNNDKNQKMIDKKNHLTKQLILINSADISTIDGFCLKLVKANFSALGIDSSYKIADEGILKLIKSDILDELFEENYYDEDFMELMDIFGKDKAGGESLRGFILKVLYIAEGFPDPEKWLDEAINETKIEDEEAVNNSKWFKEYVRQYHNVIRDMIVMIKDNLSLTDLPDAPDVYAPALEADLESVSKILDAHTYSELRNASTIAWTRFARAGKDLYDEDLVKKIKENRDKVKAVIKEHAFSKDIEGFIEEIQLSSCYLLPLIEIIKTFRERYMKAKERKKIMEFSDIQHMAYKLVCAGYNEEGLPIPTELAVNISNDYDEIYIDEYQDSNYIQEDILCSVSKINKNIFNMFMVGDVKQSIYRFRLARPGLFIDKYNKYEDEGNNVLIELRNNFRSRKEVLQPVNFFFYQLMGEDLGQILYNKNVALEPTKKIPVKDDKDLEKLKTEIIFIEGKPVSEENPGKTSSAISYNDPLDEEMQELEKNKLEAEVIAKRIIELVDPINNLTIFDEKEECYRQIKYSDICILSRNLKGFGEVLYDTLTASGIPVYVENTKGYFKSTEIRLILSFLAVIDNVLQDIPLAAVLLSPIANLNESELSVITDFVFKETKKLKKKVKLSLYERCECYLAEDKNDEISFKLQRILGIINELKIDKKFMSIPTLIWKALDITGYYIYAKAMPHGNRRKTNIDMLIEKANLYESGYYKGLFNFLRYIEKLKTSEIDFGEANTIDENENVVVINTIHKSKGLEYPVVFASGLGKQFNQLELRDDLILHSDYYLASHIFYKDSRRKEDGIKFEMVKSLIKEEMASEELRLLYVALTRAKEKLILTGAANNIDKIIEKYKYLEENDLLMLPYSERLKATSYMAWIIAAMTRYDKLAGDNKVKDLIDYKILSYEEATAGMVEKEVINHMKLDAFIEKASATPVDDVYKKYKENFDKVYKFEALTNIQSKISISEIKKMKAYDGEKYEVADFDVPGLDIPDLNISEGNELNLNAPELKQKNKKLLGSERGTILHKIMELLDFKSVIKYKGEREYEEFAKKFLDKLVTNNRFTLDEIKFVSAKSIARFLMSDLGKRMIAADASNNLYKEQQFSVGVPVSEIYSDIRDGDFSKEEKEKDVVIVQGIIDAFFYEGEDVILVDYKTDKASEEEIIKRYKVQLDYYAKTLNKLTHKQTKKVIYSFYLEKEIYI